MATLIMTAMTPMIATFCKIPIYFLRTKKRLTKIAPTVTQMRINSPN